MKRFYWYTVFALIMLLGAYQIAIAGPGQGKRNNLPGNQNQPPVNYVEALQLTDEQVSQIAQKFHSSQNTISDWKIKCKPPTTSFKRFSGLKNLLLKKSKES